MLGVTTWATLLATTFTEESEPTPERDSITLEVNLPEESVLVLPSKGMVLGIPTEVTEVLIVLAVSLSKPPHTAAPVLVAELTAVRLAVTAAEGFSIP